jgi:hypothetical protein
VSSEQLRAAGVAAIGELTGEAAIDALIAAGLFPISTEASDRLISDSTEDGIRTMQWQARVRYVTDWKPGLE